MRFGFDHRALLHETSSPHAGLGSSIGMSLAIPEVLGRRCKVEFVASAVRPAQPQPIELQNAFEMGEQHLDFLSLAP